MFRLVHGVKNMSINPKRGTWNMFYLQEKVKVNEKKREKSNFYVQSLVPTMRCVCHDHMICEYGSCDSFDRKYNDRRYDNEPTLQIIEGNRYKQDQETTQGQASQNKVDTMYSGGFVLM